MTSFLQRYGAVFGGGQALLLRMAGLSEAEHDAEGAWVRDLSGRAWLDFGSFGLHLLGHRHPHIVAAAIEQIGRMGLSTKILGSGGAIACAEALAGSFRPRMDGVVFGNSGAESVEAALKACRIATGRRRVMALRGSYHGKTEAALAISDTIGRRYQKETSEVVFVEPGDIATAREHLTGQTIAAAFVEPVQGEGGMVPVPPDFVAALAQACRVSGTLLVLDEIQTGLGRCGRMWAAEALDCEPDIVLAGKTLGGGLIPVSAMIYRRASLTSAALDPLLHASTFSGSPLACGVAHAVVRTVSEPAFRTRLEVIAALVADGLQRSLGERDGVVAIRGLGLMWGVRFSSAELAGEVVLEAARQGLLISFCLSNPSVVRFYPPAIASDDEIHTAIGRLGSAVGSATARVFGARGDAADMRNER